MIAAVELLLVSLAVVGVICLSAIVSPWLKIAAPLLLVGIGIGVGFLPMVPPISIEPEWILAGLLPPLLYAAAVSMPVMDFRRELGAISGLSVLLVVLSAVLLGLFFWWAIPDLGLAWGIALGAIVSPTDAVATSIVKSTGVSPRIIAILDGESLLNDASALVMLRTAIAASAAAVSLWGVLGDFVFAVVVAALIGYAVGKANLALRSRVEQSTVNTVLSFAVPFAAFIPAEELGASGLVAAVVAGLVTGHGAPRMLSARHRISDSQNWRTVEFVLESLVFLAMGLELHGMVLDRPLDGVMTVPHVVLIAAAALVGSLAIRAGFVGPLLYWLKRRSQRSRAIRPTLEKLQRVLETGQLPHVLRSPDGGADGTAADAAEIPEAPETQGRGRGSEGSGGGGGDAWRRIAVGKQGKQLRMGRRRRGQLRRARRMNPERLQTRVRRALADIDYFLNSPLTARDGSVVVWAGMRGAVTVAAAQTLPSDAPHRPLLVLTAFLVAALSLLVQGGTLSRFIRLVRPTGAPSVADQDRERAVIEELLAATARDVEREFDGADGAAPDSVGTSPAIAPPSRYFERRLAVIEAQRDALLEARDDGVFDAAVLAAALNVLDAGQLSVELQGGGSE